MTTGFPQLPDFDTIPEEQSIYVPVPADFQTLKKMDFELAIDWRMKTRNIFQQLFDKGYTAVSLERGKNEPVHRYKLLERSLISK
ncbi:hypothetical protein ACI2OX_02860 [Bacillus sp. N9]